MSFGVATITPNLDEEPSDLLKLTDAALYNSKNAGSF